MSGGYPGDCSQVSHDRAFGELGPSPAELAAEADADNDLFEEDAYWDNVREVRLEEMHDEMLASDMEANRPIHDDDDFDFQRPVCPACEGAGCEKCDEKGVL